MLTREKIRERRSRTARHFDFGKRNGSKLLPLFLGKVGYCDTIAATCRFILRGPTATVSNPLSIRTEMQSFGCRPQGVANVRIVDDVLVSDSPELPCAILSIFELSINDLLARYGLPQANQSIVIDLVDIVEPTAVEAEMDVIQSWVGVGI